MKGCTLSNKSEAAAESYTAAVFFSFISIFCKEQLYPFLALLVQNAFQKFLFSLRLYVNVPTFYNDALAYLCISESNRLTHRKSGTLLVMLLLG